MRCAPHAAFIMRIFVQKDEKHDWYLSFHDAGSRDDFLASQTDSLPIRTSYLAFESLKFV
jgi:hypothetical protein